MFRNIHNFIPQQYIPIFSNVILLGILIFLHNYKFLALINHFFCSKLAKFLQILIIFQEALIKKFLIIFKNLIIIFQVFCGPK